MSPILFYGVPEGCSFGSIVALEWLGEPYRLCRVQMPEEVSSDRFAPVNPVRETPTLMTADGRFLSESMAILGHIAERGISRGLGHRQGTAAFDQLNQMLAFLNTSLFSAFSPLFHVFEHEQDEASKAALLAFGRNQVGKAFGNLETLLNGRDWLLGGERPGIADAYFAGTARWNDFHKAVDWAAYPRVTALYQRLQQEPAVRFAHAIEEEHEVVSAGGFLGHISLDAVPARAAA
ncbi:glutathione S-transferase family protein [Bosea sp. (in: a-proteobacteria)]|jgi:glutathione S-transferase|uniref:glutathione S-transferase family protein n=1 Tax=Bosea sp. (in: a-proteobacteria) TaxID=1871050 RepID=UPI003F711E69